MLFNQGPVAAPLGTVTLWTHKMPENPSAMSPADQPTVNLLTAQCRVLTRQITARDLSPASTLSKNVLQIFKLTGDANLAGYVG
jgi:hypothetical protein